LLNKKKEKENVFICSSVFLNHISEENPKAAYPVLPQNREFTSLQIKHISAMTVSLS